METTVLTKEQALVKEIHDTFDREADLLLLVDAATRKIDYTAKIAEIEQEQKALQSPTDEKAERLELLGFSHMPEVVKLKKEIAGYRDRRDELHKKHTRLSKQIVDVEFPIYYKKKYPFLKFITEETLDRLCKKYNLVCAPVSKYIGNVPDKNLAEISSVHIDEKDTNASALYYYFDRDNTLQKVDKRGLFIAADKSLFDLKGLTKNGYVFFRKKTVDPIVFRYVNYGVLIISKWGMEANDPELSVPELN
jgi:hypothetical protein